MEYRHDIDNYRFIKKFMFKFSDECESLKVTH